MLYNMVMDETPNNKRVHQKAREDAIADIAADTPFGGRREVSSTVLKESIENVDKNTDIANTQAKEQIDKKGNVGGSKVS